MTLRMGNLLPLPNPDHTRYCTDFKPPSATVGRDAPGIFRARFNPPNQYLGPCPAAPSVCSPSGAFLDDSSVKRDVPRLFIAVKAPEPVTCP